MNQILIADDDKELCELLNEYLSNEGFGVKTVHDGNAALAAASDTAYDLLILDVMMPGKNGFDTLRELRARQQLPVLMLTARGEEIDRIVGLELGADDYLPKPFNPRELLARVRAIMRRADTHHSEQEKPQTLQIGDVSLHTATMTVLCKGLTVDLTSTEFGVLAALMTHAGQVVSKNELSEAVLQRSLSRYDRALDMHVSNIRKKLGHDDQAGDRIKTVRGIGYLYVLPEAGA